MAGTGRELFASMRAAVGPADQGASIFPAYVAHDNQEKPMTNSLLNRVPVIPVVVIDDLDHAVPIAHALVAGGLPVIELTLRTPVALDAIERIASEVPEIFLGAGTIVDPGQAKQAAVRRCPVPGLARQHPTS